MTENIQEVIDYLEEHTQYWKSKVVKDLATDSEMLNDLIEMLVHEGKFFHAEASGYYVYYGDYGDGNKYTGSTPREAISAAIKEWKK